MHFWIILFASCFLESMYNDGLFKFISSLLILVAAKISLFLLLEWGIKWPYTILINALCCLLLVSFWWAILIVWDLVFKKIFSIISNRNSCLFWVRGSLVLHTMESSICFNLQVLIMFKYHLLFFLYFSTSNRYWLGLPLAINKSRLRRS